MAAKRYRSSEHRMFHRDAGYLEGRRVRRSRETRAMARRTEFGRDLIGMQWANAEFEALSVLWSLTRPTPSSASAPTPDRALVPYPVQLRGRELLMEFIGEDDGTAAPRLAETRPDARAAGGPVAPGDRRPSARSPWPGWRTATCPPTTSCCTGDGWC